MGGWVRFNLLHARSKTTMRVMIDALNCCVFNFRGTEAREQNKSEQSSVVTEHFRSLVGRRSGGTPGCCGGVLTTVVACDLQWHWSNKFLMMRVGLIEKIGAIGARNWRKTCANF